MIYAVIVLLLLVFAGQALTLMVLYRHERMLVGGIYMLCERIERQELGISGLQAGENDRVN